MMNVRIAALGPPRWVPDGAKSARDYPRNRKYKGASEAVTRASTRGTATDKDGNVSAFPANTLRRTNLGAGSAKARLNGCYNPNAVGFVGGSTGDDWLVAPATGITITPSTRIEIADGLYAVDFAISGTSATDLQNLIFYNGTGTFPAVSGDKVLAVAGASISAGTDTNIKSFKLMGREQAGSTVEATDTPTSSIGIDATMRFYQYEYFLADAQATTFRGGVRFVTAAGGAVDCTLRIYLVDISNATTNGVHGIPSFVINPTTPDPADNLNPNPQLANGATPGTPGTPPTGYGITSTAVLTMDTGVAGTLVANDGQTVTGRYFHFTGTTAASQFIAFNAIGAIAGVDNDKFQNAVYIGAINPGGGSAGNISDMSTQVLYVRSYNSSSALQQTVTSPAKTITTTLQRFSNIHTMTADTTDSVVAGLQLSPPSSTAYDFHLFIGNVVTEKNPTNTSVADTLTIENPRFTGARGALLVKFKPGEYVTTYTPMTVRDATDATNKVEVLWENTTDCVLRITREGVADADIAIDTGALTAEVESSLILSWDAANVAVSLNGNAVVSTATTMPFSGAAQALLGPVDGSITGCGYYTRTVASNRMRKLTRSNKRLVPVIFGGQSIAAGADGQRSTTTGDTAFILPAEYRCIQPGEPREFMFRMPRRELTASAGVYTKNDVRGGTNRLAESSEATDQAYQTPQTFTRSMSVQFTTSNQMMVPGEATIRALTTRFASNYLFLNITIAIGGTGLSKQRKNTTGSNGHSSYTDAITALTAAKEIARLQGWTIPFVIWCQDMSYTDGATLTASEIADEFAGLETEAAADIASLLGATVPVHWFSSMGPSVSSAALPSLAAQLELTGSWTVIADEYFASSKGGVQRLNDDGVHGSSVFYQLTGEEKGHVMADEILGVGFTPLQPSSVTRTGDNYDFVFPEAITEDVTNIVARDGHGIDLFAVVGGAQLDVDSVSFPAANTIRLTVDSGTGEAATYKGGMQAGATLADRRGINFRAVAQPTPSTYLNGMQRYRYPFAFQGTTS